MTADYANINTDLLREQFEQGRGADGFVCLY